MVLLSFEDTGVGMTKETLKSIWVPLFTTKAKGMGFGLSICKRIVEAHNGKIKVRSTLGKGTAFKILLPINKDTISEIGSNLIASKATQS